MTSTKEPTPAALDAELRSTNHLTSMGERTISTATTTTTNSTTQKPPVKKEQTTKFRAFNDAATPEVSRQHEAQSRAEINPVKDTKMEKAT